jgi:hypothetical protein
MSVYQDYHYFDLMSTCAHEAAHVIVGLLNFIKIEDVLVDLASNAGSTNYYSLINSTQTLGLHFERAQAEIIMLYAGLLAEKINYTNVFGNIVIPKDLKAGAEIDNYTASMLIKKYNLAPPGKKRIALKRKLVKASTLQIKEFWEDIVLVSHALFLKQKLSYNDLYDILTKKSKSKSFWKKQFKKINYIFDSKTFLDENQLKSIFLYLTN